MKKKAIHPIVENLNKMQENRGLTKTAFAEVIGFTESKWNKISNGEQNLQLWELSKIAEKLNMAVCDIIMYPKKIKVVDADEVRYDRVSVTFEVSSENREALIEMVNQYKKK